MENRVKSSRLNRTLTPIVFLLGGSCALIWFIYRVCILFQGSDNNIVLIDKGSYYMFGIGIGMLDLSFIVIWEQWLAKPLSKKVTKIFYRLAVLSIVLLLALPHVIHYLVNVHLKSKGYSVCEDASHQWLFVRDIVYIQESLECNESLKEK